MGTPHLSGDQAHASPCTSLTMLRNPVQQTNTSGYQYAGRSLAGACTALIFFTYPGAVTCRDVLLLPPTIETATESARENIHSTALRIQSSGLAVLEYSSSFAAGVLEVGKSMGTEVVKAAQPDTALTVWNHSNNAPTYYSVIAAAVAFSSFAAAAWFVMSSNAADDTDAPSKGANFVLPTDRPFCADVHQAEAAEHRHVSSEELKTAFERLHDDTNLQEQALALFNRSEEDPRSLASTPVGVATATKTSTPSVPVARRMWRMCCHCDELSTAAVPTEMSQASRRLSICTAPFTGPLSPAAYATRASACSRSSIAMARRTTSTSGQRFSGRHQNKTTLWTGSSALLRIAPPSPSARASTARASVTH